MSFSCNVLLYFSSPISNPSARHTSTLTRTKVSCSDTRRYRERLTREFKVSEGWGPNARLRHAEPHAEPPKLSSPNSPRPALQIQATAEPKNHLSYGFILLILLSLLAPYLVPYAPFCRHRIPHWFNHIALDMICHAPYN